MESRIIEITPAAHKHGNLNIRPCGMDFFPDGILGGSNRTKIGTQILIKAKGLPETIRTDIPTDSKTGRPRWLFRERAWLRHFVNMHNLVPGDGIVIRRVDNLTYTILPIKNKRQYKNIKSSIRATYKPKMLSLFSGCGGLDLGFHWEDYKIIWANDNNEWAVKTFEGYFGKGIINCKDIEEIDSYKDVSIPNAHLILGGFPCQDFSIIWKRKGLNGEKGNLYKYFLRFIDAKKPLAFVAENVKGLLTIHNGKAIETIINDFESIEPGYLVSPKLYNFADYGVPQFRERILIVGIRIDTGFDFKHPTPTHGLKAGKPYFTSGEALMNPIDVKMVKENNEQMKLSQRTIERLERIGPGGNFKDIPEDDALYVRGMISHVYRRIDPKKPAKTIIAAGGGGTHGYHYPEPRALTLRERARIQSFPDDFVFKGNSAEVRRQIGNAVPPEGVRSLAKNLKKLFRKDYVPIDLKAKSQELKSLTIKQRIEVDV